MSTLRPRITVERIRELYSYNPLTGRLISNKLKTPVKGYFHANRHNLNVPSLTNDRCQQCLSYGAVVYAWVHGTWAEPTVDHKDQNPLNHQFWNLRPASKRLQSQNRCCFNGGATYRKDRKNWYARIKANGKCTHLGTFATEAEAQAAYWAAVDRLEQ